MSDAYNATERSDIRIAEAAARVASREDDSVIFELMRTPSGRAWMHRRLAVCQVHSTTFTGDALTSAFKEGQRNIGLMFESDLLRVCPDEYITMMREAHGRTIVADTNRRRNRNSGDDNAGITSNLVRYDESIRADFAEPAGGGDAQVERED